MTTDDKYKNLERVNFWVANCDSKVSYLMTLQGIILTIIFTSNYSACVLKTFSYRFTFENFGWNSAFLFLEGLCLYSFFTLIFLSLINIYLTLKARIDPKVYKENGLTLKSDLFFVTIANKKFTDFVASQQNNTIPATSLKLDNDIDSQVFINSKICQLKFKYYNLTLRYCGLGFIFGLFYIVLRLKNGC